MNQPLWYFDFEALERYLIIPAASSWRLVILKKESLSRKNELPCFRIFFFILLCQWMVLSTDAFCLSLLRIKITTKLFMIH